MEAISSISNNEERKINIKASPVDKKSTFSHSVDELSSNNRKEELLKRFEAVKERSHKIRKNAALRQQKSEQRRTQNLLRKVMRDPSVKKLIEEGNEEDSGSDEGNTEGDQSKEQWQDIKPFLTVNDHIQGPVSHGSCGPKNEVESLIDKCLSEGDFEEAEILSDTLANRQFAVKIAKAFDAKRYSEELAEKEELRKQKKLKKLRWGFEPKERWQMKGNM